MISSDQGPSPSGNLSSDNSHTKARIISGFWKRTAAFLIDCIVMGIAGTVIGFLMFNKLAQFGPWGRVVGFVVAGIYFSILNSSVGNGQTFGKRILGIEVVDRLGKNISLPRSFLRYTILCLPFFFNGAMIPGSVTTSWFANVIVFVVFGLGGAILYLYLFNRQTRQSIHDLVAKTYVVYASPKGIVNQGDIWKPHLTIVGLWMVATIALGPFTILFPGGHQTFKNLVAIQKGIEATGKVHYAAAAIGKKWGYEKGKKWEVHYIRVKAFLRKQPKDYDEAAKEIASIVIARYPGIPNNRIVSVVLSYGFDIGIAQEWQNHIYSHSAGEWQKILHTTSL